MKKSRSIRSKSIGLIRNVFLPGLETCLNEKENLESNPGIDRRTRRKIERMYQRGNFQTNRRVN